MVNHPWFGSTLRSSKPPAGVSRVLLSQSRNKSWWSIEYGCSQKWPYPPSVGWSFTWSCRFPYVQNLRITKKMVDPKNGEMHSWLSNEFLMVFLVFPLFSNFSNVFQWISYHCLSIKTKWTENIPGWCHGFPRSSRIVESEVHDHPWDCP